MSEAALLRPRAPVGGTMCAASPARNRLPQRIGSATKERSGAMLFSIDGPVIISAATSSGRRRLQLDEELLVRPVVDRIGERHLDVVAAQRRRAQRAQREAALVLRVDQLRRDGLRARQHAQPAERVHALEFPDLVLRDRPAADAMEAVAADDVVAIDTHDLVLVAKGEIGPLRLDVVRLHVLGIVDHDAARSRSRPS